MYYSSWVLDGGHLGDKWERLYEAVKGKIVTDELPDIVRGRGAPPFGVGASVHLSIDAGAWITASYILRSRRSDVRGG